MDREQIAQKREQIRQQLRQSRPEKFNANDNVETTERVPTDIKSLHIPKGWPGKVISVFKWVDGYDIEFKIHDSVITVGCMKHQLK